MTEGGEGKDDRLEGRGGEGRGGKDGRIVNRLDSRAES
jgi:hypothetical protein